MAPTSSIPAPSSAAVEDTSKRAATRDGRARRFALGLLRSRALLFVVAAAVLYRFAPSAISTTGDGDVVRVSDSDLATRELLARRSAGVAALTPEQKSDVREHAIEDALLEHEARRLGLADNDLLVRRRLVQKALFLAEDLGGAFRDPTDAELRAFHREHASSFRIAGRVQFVHVFAAEEAKLTGTRAELERWTPATPGDAPLLGEAFPFSRSVDGAQAELVGRYGEGFASAVEKAPVGEVSGPYRSKFGFHLVKVVGRGEGRESRYEEVASHVSFAMLVDRRERAVDEFVRRSFARTRVEVNGSKVATLARVRRLALRDEGSAEDGL